MAENNTIQLHKANFCPIYYDEVIHGARRGIGSFYNCCKCGLVTDPKASERKGC
jgi:hypothetical protein